MVMGTKVITNITIPIFHNYNLAGCSCAGRLCLPGPLPCSGNGTRISKPRKVSRFRSHPCLSKVGLDGHGEKRTLKLNKVTTGELPASFHKLTGEPREALSYSPLGGIRNHCERTHSGPLGTPVHLAYPHGLPSPRAATRASLSSVPPRRNGFREL